MYVGIYSGCGHARIRAANVRALCFGVDRVRLGSQAFASATAFNANIGAWNTARVSNMFWVRAAFGRRRATAGVPDALGRSSMRRGRCARRHRRCARVCAHAGIGNLLAQGVRVCRNGCAEERFDICS